MAADIAKSVGIAAAAGIGVTVASARTVPPAARPAACDRKCRRVVSTGVFVGGVLSTLSAWVIGFPSFMVRVRAGAEVCMLPLGLLLRYNLKHEEVNKGCT